MSQKSTQVKLNKPKAILLNIRPHLFAILLFAFFSHGVKAQFYNSGEESASISWRQIQTTNFQILFPSEYNLQAQRLANILEYIYNQESRSLNHKPKPITVILHNRSITSNGFVVWAPKRMELYPTPPQNGFTSDCIDLLAVHELRHVVQIDKLNQGITKIASILMGEQAVGAMSSFIPQWFYEGDAVYAETAFTSSGRGRDATFEMEMKALINKQEKLPSYEQIFRGSFKDYTPNHYNYGYPIVAWSRAKFGTNIYDTVLNYVAQNPWTLMPFRLGIKKETGLTPPNLYKAAYTDLKNKWQSQVFSNPNQKEISLTSTSKKSSYTNYRYPQQVTDSSWVALKSGMDQLYQIVMLNKNGKEKILITLGSNFEGNFSYANGKIVWTEEIPDIRWPNRSYNCIRKLDLSTGKATTLTQKTRYFSPSLSSDGKQIAVVEISTTSQCFLVILNSMTGEFIQRYEIAENSFLQTPCWTDNNQFIVAVKVTRAGSILQKFDTKLFEVNNLLPTLNQPIYNPSDAGEYILFAADFLGIRNIYGLRKSDHSILQFTNEQLGASDPHLSPNKDLLIFARYTSQGYDIVSKPFIPEKRATINTSNNPSIGELAAKAEKFNFQDSAVPNQIFPLKKYSAFAHSFNLHSWAPFYYDYENLTLDYNAITPGFVVASQNKLSNCIATAGYNYTNNQSYLIGNITYKGLYPIFEFSFTHGGSQRLNGTESGKPNTLNPAMQIYGRTYLSLNFSRNKTINVIIPLISIQYKNDWYYYPSALTYREGMTYLNYNLTAYSYRTKSLRDLLPPYGGVFVANWTNAPLEKEQIGNIWYIRGKLYLPGLYKHQGLQLSGGYQKQNVARYSLYSLLAFPRGFSKHLTFELKTFSADYAFPIAYPDCHLGPLFYIKRIRGNAFGDWAQNDYKQYINSRNIHETLTSTGLDLTTDFYILRFPFPLNIGLRETYIPKLNKYSTELLFQIELNSY